MAGPFLFVRPAGGTSGATWESVSCTAGRPGRLGVCNWRRRRQRTLLWRQWKRQLRRGRKLRQLGLDEDRAWRSAVSQWVGSAVERCSLAQEPRVAEGLRPATEARLAGADPPAYPIRGCPRRGGSSRPGDRSAAAEPAPGSHHKANLPLVAAPDHSSARLAMFDGSPSVPLWL
jgi:hypothetical protein